MRKYGCVNILHKQGNKQHIYDMTKGHFVACTEDRWKGGEALVVFLDTPDHFLSPRVTAYS